MVEMMLEQHVKWGEEYVSRALNTKAAGVFNAGVYYGFVLAPGGGFTVQIVHDEDYPYSVAAVEREGYNITVRAVDAGDIVLDNVPGKYFICIEAYYAPQMSGYQRIVFKQAPEDHHIVLGCVTIPAGATEITAGMISEEGRMVGNPVDWLLSLAAKLTEVQTQNLDLMTRLSNLELWAQNHGYDKELLYVPISEAADPFWS